MAFSGIFLLIQAITVSICYAFGVFLHTQTHMHIDSMLQYNHSYCNNQYPSPGNLSVADEI